MRWFGLWTYLFQIFCPIFCATAVPSLLVNQISVPILSTKKKKISSHLNLTQVFFFLGEKIINNIISNIYVFLFMEIIVRHLSIKVTIIKNILENIIETLI